MESTNNGYAYIVSRDYGFAPNPFYNVLTLATCKPVIRKNAKVGDFIIGNAQKENNYKLIYIAKISKILTFDEYWNSPEYACKKPVMNGSLMKLYGDNIYHHSDVDSNQWIQEDSHHSLDDGSPNPKNLNRDTGKTDHVLICTEYYYLGKSMILLPDTFSKCICKNRGHQKIDYTECEKLWNYISQKYPEKGLIDTPLKFEEFKRYEGEAKQNTGK